MRIWSKSQLGMFANCPFSWKLRYIDKIKPDVVESLDKGFQIHKVFELFYPDKDFDKALKEAQFPIEYLDKYKFHLDNFKDWISKYPNEPYVKEGSQTIGNIIGIVDRADLIGDNKLFIIDYKTSVGKGNIKDYLKELLLYAYLIQEKHKMEVVKVGIYFSANNQFIVEDVTQEQIKKNYEEIQEEIKLNEEMISLDMLEPSTGYWCSWCGFKKHCPKNK